MLRELLKPLMGLLIAFLLTVCADLPRCNQNFTVGNDQIENNQQQC